MKYANLDAKDTEVLSEAMEVSRRLYVKGIQQVGAAVRTKKGHLFTGIHFETATGFATVCGEITAICCMVSAGHRDLDTIAAVSRSQEGKHYLLPPCGRCREVIFDFNPDAWVIVTSMNNHWHDGAINKPAKVRIADLLPMKSHKLSVT